MEELAVKKDFTDIYTQDSPYEYLKEMDRLEYSIPDSTKPLYNSIIEELESTLSRPINVLDLGSSYGINSSLMKYNLTMSELNDFFLSGSEPTTEEIKRFYEKCNSNDNMNFYQIDISKEALKFSEEMNLCERGMNVDLEAEKLNLLDGVKQKLGLSSAITEHIAFIYRKASVLGLIRGRGTAEVMAASVYVACRENGIPWSLDEVADTLNITKKKLSNCYRILIDRLDIKPELANPLDCLSKFCSILGVKEKTKRCAFDILTQANSKRMLSGSKPAVVCAGALYLACIANDENIPQTKIAEKVQISSPSIRKSLSVLNKALSVV